MQRVLVLDKNNQPLMPCHPARARELLTKGKAAVFRRQPFTIILKEREGGETQPTIVKVDPGSKTTGMAIVAEFKRGRRLIWAAEIEHRGDIVHDKIQKRAAARGSRRSRKTPYRPARFDNRERDEQWLAPSNRSRIQNIMTWVTRLRQSVPISDLALEVVKFDTQLLENPDISGIEYQQGTLAGYEVREYVLERDGRQCAYCGKTGVSLELDHIKPKSRGGSNRPSNLTPACHDCNQDKGNQTAKEYGFPEVQAKTKRSLRDAAAVNKMRWVLYDQMVQTGLPLALGTGGMTKYNRTQQAYPKTHWIDAACVGLSGRYVEIDVHDHVPLLITATGRQARQMCLMDKYGFPRTSAKGPSQVHGFRTGDLVRVYNPRGKFPGFHMGRISIRGSGSFQHSDGASVSWKNCQKLQSADGYAYTKGEKAPSSPL